MTDIPSLRAKVRTVEALLTAAYGKRVWRAENYSVDLIGALVATVLSQNTSDLNSGRAFLSLKSAFPGGWDDVRRASVLEIEDAIRCGGLAPTKARRIGGILSEIHAREGRTDLSFLTEWGSDEVSRYLRSFAGVGAKTAACLLMFNMGRPVLAVDTHVHRVARRIGLIGERVGAEQAHVALQELLEPDEVYSFHVHFIEHGRSVCHARRPECEICPVRSECDAYRNARKEEH